MGGDAQLQIIISALNQAQGELDKLKGELSGVGSASESASQQAGGMKSSIAGIAAEVAGATAILTGFGVVAKEAFDFAYAGAEIQRIETTSKQMATSLGMDMSAIVNAMTVASKGTVDDTDMMQSAMKSMLYGLNASADQMGKLMEIARLSSRALGIDTIQAFNGMIDAVDRLNPRTLKSMGIVLDMPKVYAAYAASIGKAAGALDEAEKRQAMLNAVLEQGGAKLKQFGSLADDTVDKVERLKTSWKNFFEEAQIHAAEGLNPIVVGMDYMFNKQSRAKTAMEEHEEEIKRGTKNYVDYTLEVNRSAEAAGFLIKANGDMVQLFRDRTGVHEELIQSNLRMTQAQYQNWEVTSRSVTVGMDELRRIQGLSGATKQLTMDEKDLTDQQKNALQASQDLDKAQEGLAQTQKQWMQSTGEQVAQGLGQWMSENSPRYTAGIKAIDAVMGTDLAVQKAHNDAVKAASAEYAKTGNVEKFTKALQGLKDSGLPQTTEELTAATKQAEQFRKELEQLAKYSDLHINASFNAIGAMTVAAAAGGTGFRRGGDEMPSSANGGGKGGGALSAGGQGIQWIAPPASGGGSVTHINHIYGITINNNSNDTFAHWLSELDNLS